MEIIVISVIAWVFMSAVVSSCGEHRKIGAAKAFLLSFIFSPIFGILIVLSSERKSDYELKRVMFHFYNEKLPE
jgi:hypothetical protein